MTAMTYEQLALGWHPSGKRDYQFKFIAIVVSLVMLAIGLIFSSIDVPKEKRVARTVVPERIAQFILQKEKLKIVKPKPKPLPKPKPRVKKTLREKPKLTKPLTKTQKKARKKAEESGLLALGKELEDLMDTSDINAMVGGKVKSSSHSTRAATGNKDLLTADAGRGSGGVGEDKYATRVSRTQLSANEKLAFRQTLATGGGGAAAGGKSGKGRRRGDNQRSDEDIRFVVDNYKSRLLSIYRRVSRRIPGLKGKIVFLVTIAPSGKVIKVTIKSSELNHKSLEAKLAAYVKQMKFGAGNVEKVTVTMPIEFLPS